jgi:hypothetical protein
MDQLRNTSTGFDLLISVFPNLSCRHGLHDSRTSMRITGNNKATIARCKIRVP